MIAQDTRGPVVGSRRERLRAMMRQEILDAARRIVKERGFPELTMRALAQAVGVTAPTLYDYFANKDGVLDALFAEGTARLQRSFDDVIAHNPPGLPRLIGIATAYRRFAQVDPDLFELIFARVTASYKPPVEVKATAKALFDVLTSVIEESIAAGQIRDEDSASLGVAVWAAVHGFVMLEINKFTDDCTPHENDAVFANNLRLMNEGLTGSRAERRS